MSSLLIIAGRVVGVLGALFLGVFALDAFSADMPWWQNLAGVLIHLLPSLVLVAFLAISWRWPLAGGALFLLAALAPFLFLSNPFWVNALLAAAPFLAGVLIIIGGILARQG